MEDKVINRVKLVHSPFNPLGHFKSMFRFKSHVQKTESAPLLCFAKVHDNILESRREKCFHIYFGVQRLFLFPTVCHGCSVVR